MALSFLCANFTAEESANPIANYTTNLNFVLQNRTRYPAMKPF